MHIKFKPCRRKLLLWPPREYGTVLPRLLPGDYRPGRANWKDPRGADKLGIADQTLIIYAGDKGIFWGEKQFIDKRWPYEKAMRIPFIVKYPGGLKNPGRTSAEMVLNVDLAPTLLDMAGLAVPPPMQGQRRPN